MKIMMNMLNLEPFFWGGDFLIVLRPQAYPELYFPINAQYNYDRITLDFELTCSKSISFNKMEHYSI